MIKCVAALLAIVSAPSFSFEPAAVEAPVLESILTDERLIEFSGLAPSHLRKDRMWAINDGGATPSVWLLDPKGKIQDRIVLKDVQNIDFEDLASFRKGGKKNGTPMLAVADIGDNAAKRGIYLIHVVQEPKQAGGEVKIAYTVKYQYPDGPHDAESLGVDAKEGYFYIATKRVTPSILYRVPIFPKKPDQLQTAELIGPLGQMQPDDPDAAQASNQIRYAAQPTSMTMGCDGRDLFLLTYAAIYQYRRERSQTWAQALKNQTPRRQVLPPIFQAEAIAQTLNCDRIYVGSEKLPSPFFSFKRK
jgi:hypothetical protein